METPNLDKCVFTKHPIINVHKAICTYDNGFSVTIFKRNTNSPLQYDVHVCDAKGHMDFFESRSYVSKETAEEILVRVINK